MSFVNGKVIRCNMCNNIAVKLVPLYDDDHKHLKQQCCQLCKKKIKKGEKIIKYIEPPELREGVKKK